MQQGRAYAKRGRSFNVEDNGRAAIALAVEQALQEEQREVWALSSGEPSNATNESSSRGYEYRASPLFRGGRSGRVLAGQGLP